ncbi:MAG: hypothetical protein LBF16_01255, partial [Pseudomonadales bacterium]|nr:hypothetical protein [Pseudomonadales bacterium]
MWEWWHLNLEENPVTPLEPNPPESYQTDYIRGGVGLQSYYFGEPTIQTWAYTTPSGAGYDARSVTYLNADGSAPNSITHFDNLDGSTTTIVSSIFGGWASNDNGFALNLTLESSSLSGFDPFGGGGGGGGIVAQTPVDTPNDDADRINVTSKNVTSTPAQTLDSFEVALK